MISILEIIDIIVMSFGVGYIFSGFFAQALYQARIIIKGKWNLIGYSSLITAPAVVFHELAHKFVALSLGQQATFFAACSTQNIIGGDTFFGFPCILFGLAILAKLTNFGFVFLVPGYVSHTGTTPFLSSLIAFSGPFLNLVLWLVPKMFFKHPKVKKNRKLFIGLVMTSKINLFLFLFNMLPIPPFDGYWFITGLWQTFF